MNLIKEVWTSKDIEDYYKFQKSLIGLEEDCKWEQRIVNTKLACFGRTSSKAKEVVKEIKKGNFVDFIDKLEVKTHFDSLVLAFLICQIKDFDTFSQKLDKYVLTIDNWASADTLKFQKKDLNKLYNMSLKYLKSEKPFVRRVGLNIFFELIKNDDYVDKCFEVLNSLKYEKEYYVNMCGAWLLSDCFARNREKTLLYFEKNDTNDFIINKAISKCRDSFRVPKEDKDLLLKYKI